MKKKKIKNLGIFLVVLLIVSIFSFGNFFAKEDTDMIVKSHKITESEIEKLKELEGVYELGVNYNIIIDGHGTGLRPPTEEQWNAMVGQITVVDEISLLLDTAPPSIDNSATIWFPPIGNQGPEGSCVCFAVGYYVKTFQEAKDHNWDLSGAPQWDKIMSPDFIYHQINNGVDNGSYYSDAINLVCNIGASSWETMPYSSSDHTSWPSEAAWREAPLYRGDGGYNYASVTSSVEGLKNWLVDGNLAIISINANEYSKLTAEDLWKADTYIGSTTNHANTIVGYDDSFGPYTEQGQQRYGAFKVVNSWGIGGWEKVPDGFYWISYEAMKQRVQYFMFYDDKIDYDPAMIAVFEMTHTKRNECDITAGKGNPASPTQTKSFAPWNWDGGALPFPNNKIIFDITEFYPTDEDIFLKVYDGGSSTTGTLESFSVEFYYSTYDPTGAADEVLTSNDTPINTVHGGNIYAVADVPVEPPTITWTRVWTFDGQTWTRIDGGGNATVGNKVRFCVRTPDATSVQIAYGPSGNLGSPQTAVYLSSKDYWYVDWDIPLDATLGAYDVQVVASNAYGDTQEDYPSYFNVINDPQLYVYPTSHDFGTINEGQTDSWSFNIENSGGGTLTWNVSESISWVTSVTPESGTTTTETDTVTVDIDTTGLTVGQHYDGNISGTSDGGNQDIYVEVTIASGGPPPTITWTRVWTFDGQTWTRIDGGGNATVGNKVRFCVRTPDATSVQIAYGPSGNLGSPQTAVYLSSKDYWYVDWDIPLDATLGAYDVQVVASNAHGDTIEDRLPFFNVIIAV